MTHVCVNNLTIFGSDNGFAPGRRQAIIWTNDGILLIRPFGTNFSEISIEILTFSLKKMRLKMSSAKWWPFCPSLNVLRPRVPVPLYTRSENGHYIACRSPSSWWFQAISRYSEHWLHWQHYKYFLHTFCRYGFWFGLLLIKWNPSKMPDEIPQNLAALGVLCMFFT